MKRLIQLFLVFGLLFLLQSCNKENIVDNPDNLTAPLIPSATLLSIPTQSFGLVGDKESATTRNDKANWLHAGVNVLVWNSIIFTHTSVPIAAFGHSFDYKAEYLGDLTWEWKYNYKAPLENGGNNFDVSLTGQYINENKEIAWTMTVSKPGNSNGFVWYEGVTAADNSYGTFRIKTVTENPEPYLEISFEVRNDKSDLTIRYNNILESHEGFGDYIEWSTDNELEYDRSYDVFTNNNLLQIESNNALDYGRVKDPKHFDDNQWHCWNASKFSIDC